jgi:hypothetical protein
MSFEYRPTVKRRRLLRICLTNLSSSLCCHPPPIFALQYMTTRSTGSIYFTTSGYVINLAVQGQENTLEKEAKIYEIITTQDLSHIAPQYFGLFGDQSLFTLILSYEGDSFDSF